MATVFVFKFNSYISHVKMQNFTRVIKCTPAARPHECTSTRAARPDECAEAWGLDFMKVFTLMWKTGI